MKLTLDNLELIEQNIKVLCVLNGSFDTYTRYSGENDEKQKKVSDVFNVV